MLVSHPHYDHDANYYLPADAPVFRAAGEYSVGDVKIRGVAGRHAEPYGEEFGRRNTLWVLETGGLRIAHLGDTGRLESAAVAALGRVDVLMLPVDDMEHILKFAEVEAIRRELAPRVTIPMHYRLSGVTELPKDVGPIDRWLTGRRDVRRLPLHRTAVLLPKAPETWVFPPSPDVKPWSDRMKAARAAWDAARALPAAQGLAGFRRAVELAPEVSVFSHALAKALVETGSRAEAVAVLERALARDGPKDWEYARHMRTLLDELHAARRR